MEQLCLELVLIMTVPFTKEIEEITDKEAGTDVINQIKETLEAMDIEEIRVLDKNIYKC